MEYIVWLFIPVLILIPLVLQTCVAEYIFFVGYRVNAESSTRTSLFRVVHYGNYTQVEY